MAGHRLKGTVSSTTDTSSRCTVNQEKFEMQRCKLAIPESDDMKADWIGGNAPVLDTTRQSLKLLEKEEGTLETLTRQTH
jgi:hypothetical protein